MLNLKQLTHLRTALEMYIKSNERMKASKPLYAPMFDAIALELTEIQNILQKMTVETDKRK